MAKKIKPAAPLIIDSGAAQAAMIATPSDKSEPPKILRITCTHEGFRRGGRAWSTTPTEVHADEFTAVQLQQLYAEQRLTVEALG